MVHGNRYLLRIKMIRRLFRIAINPVEHYTQSMSYCICSNFITNNNFLDYREFAHKGTWKRLEKYMFLMED